MGTTMTFVCFHQGGCMMAHIGDSRIYQVRPGQGIVYRSEDHSLVNSMVRAGVISPEQSIDHPQSNVITRCMEPKDPDRDRCMATVVSTTDVRRGDYFLLCTDVGTQEEVVSPSDIRRADYRRHTTVSIRIFRFHTSGDDIALRMVDALFWRNDTGTHHGVDQRMVFRTVNDALPRANLIDAAIPDVRHHAPTLMETDEGHRRTHVLRASTCLGIEIGRASCRERV